MPSGVQRFTDSTPPSSASRTATRSPRRPPSPAHSASPWRSSVSSTLVSTNESRRGWPARRPPSGSTSTSFGIRSAVASAGAGPGKEDARVVPHEVADRARERTQVGGAGGDRHEHAPAAELLEIEVLLEVELALTQLHRHPSHALPGTGHGAEP